MSNIANIALAEGWEGRVVGPVELWELDHMDVCAALEHDSDVRLESRAEETARLIHEAVMHYKTKRDAAEDLKARRSKRTDRIVGYSIMAVAVAVAFVAVALWVWL